MYFNLLLLDFYYLFSYERKYFINESKKYLHQLSSTEIINAYLYLTLHHDRRPCEVIKEKIVGKFYSIPQLDFYFLIFFNKSKYLIRDLSR